MTDKAPAIISTVSTVILLIILGVLSVLFEMLALNGASESQGTMAMGISLVCQGVSLIVIGMLTWRLTNLLISKFNWNRIIAVIVAIVSGVALGMGISFFSLIISIPAAGIR